MGAHTSGYLDGNQRYHVARGDCLWNIALDYMGNGRRYPEIKTANGLKSNVIYVGNVFNIPGVTPGYGGAPAPAPSPSPPNVVNIVWFSLRADTQREMQIIWEHSALKFKIRYEMKDLSGRWWTVNEEEKTFTSDQQKASSNTNEEANDRFVCCVRVKAIDNDGNDITGWSDKEYDFRENPPPPPEISNSEIDNNDNLLVEFENVAENVGIESIEIAVYQDNDLKYDTFIIQVNQETRYASHTSKVDPGHYYRLKARSIRYTLPDGTRREEGIRGNWTDYSSNMQSSPTPPNEILVLSAKEIIEQGTTSYGVKVEWDVVPVAKTYTVQWTENPEYFDDNPGEVHSQDTEEGQGPKILLTDIELGHTYYFRVGSNNDKGSSLTWTPIKSLNVGSRPSAPTTWSNTNNNILGETTTLYWTHNATDGSLETEAMIELTLIRWVLNQETHQYEMQSFTFNVNVDNERPETDPSRVSSYIIDTSDSVYINFFISNAKDFKIKWKAKTRGVTETYSEFSVEREINVYEHPTLQMDIKNKYDEPITDIYEFPFSIDLLARPSAQTPISYYIEIIANNSYETVDSVGIVKSVNAGDIIYTRHVDPLIPTWDIRAYITPGDIDLQSGFEYTVKATVAMNSGLTAEAEQTFNTEFDTSTYDVFADIVVDKETLQASIKPYANEWYYVDDEPHTRLAENCILSVYRREYDGSFIEIGTDIPNGEDMHVTDPHPALDYARYRVVVRSEDNGSISYRDIEAVKVGEPSIVIQWAEEWTKFETETNEEPLEPSWKGSMIKIPYNVDVSEKTNPDVTLVDYVGRKNPVSYYGTKIGETASWSVEIPSDDKEMIYELRRLSKWMDNVYVREPSGVGYWANINLNFSLKHKAVTIPVTFEIKRVEGGI